MKKISKRTDSGETLVEVLLAVAVLALIVVSSLAIMNRSLRNMQNSFERSLVRAEINSETEMLWWVRDNNTTMWGNILSLAYDSEDNAEAISGVTNGQCDLNDDSSISASAPGSFILRSNKDTLAVSLIDGVATDEVSGQKIINDTPATHAVIGSGLWVDAVKYMDAEGGPYVDFYIKACWNPLGSDIQSQTTTVVRMAQ